MIGVGIYGECRHLNMTCSLLYCNSLIINAISVNQLILVHRESSLH